MSNIDTANPENYQNTDSDKMQDAGNADAAKFNTDEQENAVNEREEDGYSNAENANASSEVSSSDQSPPLTTQGDIAEVEENLGGTTNLTLDQLKKESDPEGNEQV